MISSRQLCIILATIFVNYMILTVSAHGTGEFGEFGHEQGGHSRNGHHLGHGDVGADLFPWILG